VAELIEQIRLATQALAEFGANLFNPTVRLGVTGRSNAGKTVFITALVHGLVRGGRGWGWQDTLFWPLFIGTGIFMGVEISRPASH
jgi:hypothetical protein